MGLIRRLSKFFTDQDTAILYDGELAIDMTTRDVYMGDGATVATSCPTLLDGAVTTNVSNTFTERQIFNKVAYSPETAITYASTINWDLDVAPNARVTLTGNPTLAAPTNMVQGGVYRIRFIQDATAGWAVTFNSAYKQPFGTSVTWMSTPNDVNYFEFYCYDGSSLLMTVQTGYAI